MLLIGFLNPSNRRFLLIRLSFVQLCLALAPARILTYPSLPYQLLLLAWWYCELDAAVCYRLSHFTLPPLVLVFVRWVLLTRLSFSFTTLIVCNVERTGRSSFFLPWCIISSCLLWLLLASAAVAHLSLIQSDCGVINQARFDYLTTVLVFLFMGTQDI